MKSAIIIENLGEVEILLDLINNNKIKKKEIDIFALNPNIRFKLLYKGLNCYDSSIFTNKEFYSNIMEKCLKIEKTITSNKTLLKEKNYYTNSLFYFSRQVLLLLDLMIQL